MSGLVEKGGEGLVEMAGKTHRLSEMEEKDARASELASPAVTLLVELQGYLSLMGKSELDDTERLPQELEGTEPDLAELDDSTAARSPSELRASASEKASL